MIFAAVLLIAAVATDKTVPSYNLDVKFPNIDFASCCNTGNKVKNFREACSKSFTLGTCTDIKIGTVVTFSVPQDKKADLDTKVFTSSFDPIVVGATSYDVSSPSAVNDNCEGISCLNGGMCISGSCICNDPWYGYRCHANSTWASDYLDVSSVKITSPDETVNSTWIILVPIGLFILLTSIYVNCTSAKPNYTKAVEGPKITVDSGTQTDVSRSSIRL